MTLYCGGELYDFVKSVEEELKTVFIVSRVDVVKGGEGAIQGEVEGFSVTVGKAGGEKCERCWVYSDTVARSGASYLCARCAAIDKRINEEQGGGKAA